MVVTFLPAAKETGVTQERLGAPSRCLVGSEMCIRDRRVYFALGAVDRQFHGLSRREYTGAGKQQARMYDWHATKLGWRRQEKMTPA